MILPNFLFDTQREEGMIQGELNNSDSSQYIRELKDQIDELKAEVSPEKEKQNPWKGWEEWFLMVPVNTSCNCLFMHRIMDWSLQY